MTELLYRARVYKSRQGFGKDFWYADWLYLGVVVARTAHGSWDSAMAQALKHVRPRELPYIYFVDL